MRQFQNILYVTDTSLKDQPALEQAVDLAGRNGADLTIIEVMDRLPVFSVQKAASIVRRVRLQERKEELAQLVSGISDRVKANAEIVEGRAFLGIVRKVLADGHDLVIKPAGGRVGGLGRLFSSTDMHLLRKCPCPVWLVKPVKPKRRKRIIAAVDFDDIDSDTSQDGLNRQIIELSVTLSAMQNSELCILHVWNPFLGTLLSSPRSGLSQESVAKYVREEKLAHQRKLTSLMRDAEKWLGVDLIERVAPKSSMIKGPAGPTIVQQTRTRKTDLIVMGTVGRGGIEGLLVGNTAEQIFEEIDCSVLAVKPPDFVSPIKLDETS